VKICTIFSKIPITYCHTQNLMLLKCSVGKIMIIKLFKMGYKIYCHLYL